MDTVTPGEGKNPENTEVSFDDRINHIMHYGYKFNLAKYISDGNAIMMKNVWGFMGFMFIYILISLIMSRVPALSLVSLVISPPLSAGVYLVAHRIAKGKKEDFKNFFDGFKFLFPLLSLTLLTLLIMILIGGLYVAPVLGPQLNDLSQWALKMQNGNATPEDLAFFAGILYKLIPLLIILLVLSILFSFSTLIVIFGKKSAFRALLTSGNIVGRKFFHFFLLFILIGLINLAGLLFLVVGFFYTSALSVCIIYAAYEDIVGTNESDIPV